MASRGCTAYTLHAHSGAEWRLRASNTAFLQGDGDVRNEGDSRRPGMDGPGKLKEQKKLQVYSEVRRVIKDEQLDCFPLTLSINGSNELSI